MGTFKQKTSLLLPPPDRRKSLIIPVAWLHSGLRLDRDGDYLCYIAFIATTCVAILTFLLLLTDALLGTSIIIDGAAFNRDKLLLSVAWSRIVGPAALIIALVFYAKIRAHIDLMDDPLPVRMIRRRRFENVTRRNFLVQITLFLILFIGCLLLSEKFVVGITHHYGMQESLLFIAIAMLAQLITVPYFVAVVISILLCIEKAYRFFPSFMDNLKTHGGNAPWDN